MSYALVLPLELTPELKTIAGANSYIMEQNRRAVELLLNGGVTIAGHTDLVWNGKKFSGNSQRRTRNALLFHGTFLLKFDLLLVEKALQMPLLQPDYRQQRPHGEFIGNIPLSPLALKSALRQAWQVSGKFTENLDLDMEAWLAEKYGNPQWHEKF